MENNKEKLMKIMDFFTRNPFADCEDGFELMEKRLEHQAEILENAKAELGKYAIREYYMERLMKEGKNTIVVDCNQKSEIVEEANGNSNCKISIKPFGTKFTYTRKE